MKKIIFKYKVYLIFIAVIISLSYASCILRHRILELENTISNNVQTIKAYNSELDSVKGNSQALKLNVDQLNYFSDSLIVKLNDVRKELKIKDKEIESLKYISSNINKKDTIVYSDTIFNNTFTRMDTTIEDHWSTLNLSLIYPNILQHDITFRNECYIITHSKKETINPPKKYWILRLFQKKHKVLKVEVVEKNKYATQKNQRFIEVIK